MGTEHRKNGFENMSSLLVRALAPILVAAGLFSGGAFADTAHPQSSESRVIRNLGDRAIHLLSAETLTAKQRAEGFGDFLVTGFNLDYIARFALGRHWNNATALQRRQYLSLFRQYVIKTYASRLRGYSGETFEIVAQRRAGAWDVVVRTRIARPGGGAMVDADWRVRKFEGEHRIIDVMAEGISMAITQRQEFSSVIRRKGMDGLIEDLRVRTATVKEAGLKN